MHLDSLRVRSRRVLLITGAVVLTSTLVAAWPWRWPEFARILGSNATLGVCVGGLYWLTEPLLIEQTRRLSPKWQWGFRILVWTAVLNLGTGWSGDPRGEGCVPVEPIRVDFLGCVLARQPD